jgi:LAS superfamily LD-carboxypeptidase LdcB
MKGWAAGVAIAVVVVAAGLGLWVTWDSTQTAATDPVPPPTGMTTTTSRVPAEEVPLASSTTLPPPCEAGEEVVVEDPGASWDRVVIDTAHRLPEDFVPSDLVTVRQAGFSTMDQVRSIVIDDLAAMRVAADANGTPLVVVSGYRSYSYQSQLFQRRVNQVGEAEAAHRTARPGHSEHQLGTAVDVLDPGGGELTLDFAATPQGQWVAAHAYEFGFVLSYPDDAADRTCYAYEPWHLRYVGRETAQAIHDAGVTPREWMLSQPAETPTG